MESQKDLAAIVVYRTVQINPNSCYFLRAKSNVVENLV